MTERGEEGRYDNKPSWRLEEIRRKCKAFGIETEIDNPNMLWVEFPEQPRWPDGSIEYILWIDDGLHAQFALEAPFERCRRFGENYSGVWSQSLGIVECEIVSCESPSDIQRYSNEFSESIENALTTLGLNLGDEESPLDPEFRLRLETCDGTTVSIGPSSDDYAIWHMDVFSEDSLTGEDLEVARVLTLQVEGVEIGNETQASKAIERFGNAALFEIDCALGVGLRLRRLVGRAHKAVEHEANIPKYLALEYDMEPMSLYWYARSATDLPLLVFLAYYQVIEFYFPIHSRRKALEALRTTLAGLTFETMREADLVKVLETIKANRKGSFGPEREQLKATLEQCVSQESLREFFLEDRGRRYFFSSEACTVISPTTVPASDAPRDWRSEVARRVYEIRNRIVHAKGGYDDLGPLLPNDLETKQLSHDIALVRFLARQVLHTNARPLGG